MRCSSFGKLMRPRKKSDSASTLGGSTALSCGAQPGMAVPQELFASCEVVPEVGLALGFFGGFFFFGFFFLFLFL